MLCENCHFNEAEVKLTVKGIDSTHENGYVQYVPKEKIPGYILTMIIRIIHQDDIEEAFVVKQILQHLAAKHGINFHEMAFKEEKDAQHVR